MMLTIGREPRRSVGEDAVSARLSTDGLRVVEARAVPRELPWPKCPRATASVEGITGVAVEDLRKHVTRHLAGVSPCTHLNDALRSLADARALVDQRELAR